VFNTHVEYGIRPTRYQLPDTTRLGRVVLQVSNLERSLSYYRDLLGFEVLRSDSDTARLGVPEAADGIVELRERSGVRPVPRGGTIGLYHFAVLLPDRAALGRFVDRLLTLDLRFGSADHAVSESIYLWDPDNLGIEIYADRPRHTWRARGGELVMGTEPLDLPAVSASAEGATWSGMPAGTTIGHMHLSIGDLEAGRAFYHDGLGLDLTVWSYPGALFYSAGGYHHHLGTNTWAAHGRPAGADEARLLEWQLMLPSTSDVQQASISLRTAGFTVTDDGVAADPWGTQLRLRSNVS
jgi:catechol 2,3-dioxygenase